MEGNDILGVAQIFTDEIANPHLVDHRGLQIVCTFCFVFLIFNQR